ALDFILPKMRSSDGGADEKLVSRLVHLAKYRNVQALQNRDEGSRLANKLSLRLLGWQSDYDESDTAKPQPQPFADPANPTVPHGGYIVVEIKNNLAPDPKDPDDLSCILNVVLLGLEATWRIGQAWPQGADYRSIQPGEGEVFALHTTVPDGVDRTVDTLK